jgi:hypothetical protein
VQRVGPFEARVFPQDPDFGSDVAGALQGLEPSIEPELFVDALQTRLARRHPAVRVKMQDPLATLGGPTVAYVYREGSPYRSGNEEPWLIALAGDHEVETTNNVGRDGGRIVAAFRACSSLQAGADRGEPIAQRGRTLVVTDPLHRALARCATAAGHESLEQPDDRGSAAAILLGAAWVAKRDANATLVIAPSDPLDLGSSENLRELVARTHSDPDRLLLVGTPSTGPEPAHAWIKPGAVIGTVIGRPVRTVPQFVDDPSEEAARSMHAKGWLWSTRAVFGLAPTFLALGHARLPEITDRIETLILAAAEGRGSEALKATYSGMPRADFARDLLKLVPERLAVAVLPNRALAAGRAPRLDSHWHR